jgi:hypothetical protein
MPAQPWNIYGELLLKERYSGSSGVMQKEKPVIGKPPLMQPVSFEGMYVLKSSKRLHRVQSDLPITGS